MQCASYIKLFGFIDINAFLCLADCTNLWFDFWAHFLGMILEEIVCRQGMLQGFTRVSRFLTLIFAVETRIVLNRCVIK